MKQSHITTPRTQEECQFAMNADPIERLDRPMDWQDRVVVTAGLLAFLAVLAICFFYRA